MTLFTRTAWLAVALGAAACDDGGGDAAGDAAPVADAGAEDGAPSDAGPRPDTGGGNLPPLSVDRVSGDLTYAEGGHLHSVQVDGQLRLRITRTEGLWTHHAVGPDPRYVVAVWQSAPGAPGEVRIIDVRRQTDYAISPEGCDAGIGGVGWRDRARVMFAMACGDEPSAIYLAASDDRSRDPARLLKISDHDEPVRDVFPAVGTTLYTYVVDAEHCAQRCVVKPQVWAADEGTGLRCRVSNGDPAFFDVSTVTGDDRRLGDHNPSFNHDLTSIVFSRNVAGKPAGPSGHHDLMRVGLNLRALFNGDAECAQDGTLVNLSSAFLDETYPGADGTPVVGDERYPRAAAGRAPPGALLYTAETHAAGETGAVLVLDISGNRNALTPERGRAGFASWIVTGYSLDGER